LSDILPIFHLLLFAEQLVEDVALKSREIHRTHERYEERIRVEHQDMRRALTDTQSNLDITQRRLHQAEREKRILTEKAEEKRILTEKAEEEKRILTEKAEEEKRKAELMAAEIVMLKAMLAKQGHST